ncbi:MAG: hypothetical protein KF784_13070 [Fimbriimonadaceae bacterium]|nr:hypothetical protein [Fimbriimonadaceae bacterium]
MASDGWVFCAIPSDGKATDLPNVIWSVDGIQKLLITRTELSSGLNRLLRAGFIEHSQGRYWLTTEGIEAAKRAKRGSPDVYAACDALAEVLYQQGVTCPEASPIVLTEAEFQAAVESYKKQFEEAYQKLMVADE